MKRTKLLIDRYRWQYSLKVLCSQTRLLKRRAKLLELITWAKRKRLLGPLYGYQQQLNQIDERLLYHHMRNRRSLELAQFAYIFTDTLASFVRPYRYARA